MQKQRVNILIGRFQPLHRGHAAILQKITSSNNLSIILIGSADTARTVKNPLTFSERKQFIEKSSSLKTIGREFNSLPILSERENATNYFS